MNLWLISGALALGVGVSFASGYALGYGRGLTYTARAYLRDFTVALTQNSKKNGDHT